MDDLALTPERRAEYQEAIRDPVLFAQRVLGVELWSAQVEMLRAIESSRRVAIKACHQIGKSFSLAIATLWWLARWDDGMVLTTAPTERTTQIAIWKEIHTLAARSRIPFPNANYGSMWLRDRKKFPDNFAFALTANRPENFQGAHSKHMMIIADEAPGIESGIWDAIAGSLGGRDARIIMAGNPTKPMGAFYDAFNREKAMWRTITMSVFDLPHLAGLTIDDLLRLDPRLGGPLDEIPDALAYMPTGRWVIEQYLQWWHGDEESSPMWMARVLGQFPGQAPNSLFKRVWLARANRPAEDHSDARLIAGVDVGGGQAETVCYLCQALPGEKRILKFGAWRSEDTLDDVARFLDPYLKRLTSVRVDADGIGLVFGVELRKKGFPVELVHVGIPAEGHPGLGAEDPSLLYVNRKAQYYQHLASAFRNNEISGLTDDLTITQLLGILVEMDSRGRLAIESKAAALKRGIPSPDRAEALMLALGAPVQEYVFLPVPKTPSQPMSDWDRKLNEDPPRTGGSKFGGKGRAY